MDGFYFFSTNISFFNGQADGTDGIGIEFLVNGNSGRLLHSTGPNMYATGANPVTQGTNGILRLFQGATVQVQITQVGSPIVYDLRSFSGFFIADF